MSFKVEVSDQAVREALRRLQGTVEHLSPVLRAIGEGIMERTKQRFATATDPGGSPWAPNAQATIEAYIAARGGFGKRGINKKGQALAMGKRPLQGESGDLARQFHVFTIGDSSVTVGSSPVYAAIQQRGGQAGRGKKVTIPARPFLPVTAADDLYPGERDIILAELARYIETGQGKG